VWHSLGLEFWLVLPLLGLGFWLASGLLTDRMLARSNRTTVYLQGDRQPQQQPPRTVESITVIIKARQNLSTINIETANSALKQLRFEFPTTEPAQIEAAISRELGLPRDRVRSLVRYRSK
jgi:cell division protein FtsX